MSATSDIIQFLQSLVQIYSIINVQKRRTLIPTTFLRIYIPVKNFYVNTVDYDGKQPKVMSDNKASINNVQRINSVQTVTTQKETTSQTD